MIPSRAIRIFAAGSLVALVSACSSSGSGTASSPAQSGTSGSSTASSTTPPPASAKPVGIIALGHSGLTGEDSDPNHPHQDAKQNSWATGTAPGVDSLYLRLVAANPATQGHVDNEAIGGSDVGSLQRQATTALALVPKPQLVIIQSIDNDIKCNGTDKANLAPYGSFLKDTLQLITDATPDSTILLIGQLSRPSATYVQEVVASDPSAKAMMTGYGICDSYDPSGHLEPKNFATLTSIINGYETEMVKVCAMFRNCHTDEGVRAAYIDKLGTYAEDLGHLNVHGLAGEAALEWPVVAKALAIT